MKTKLFILTLLISLFISCGNSAEDLEFANTVSGKYLYSLDETIEVFHENGILYFKWRGANKIKPLKLGKDIFFIKEMNEKVQFLVNPSDNDQYISLIPKEENVKIGYDFKKMEDNKMLPSEYLKNNEFEKALIAYTKIKEQDSLSPFIKESRFNSLGYRLLRDNEIKYALRVLKLNVALYPQSSNVYDSFGEALLRNGDTIQSLKSYRKALEMNSNNGRARRIIEKLEKK